MLRQFQKFLPRRPLITINKSFINPHVDYGNIIYDKAYNVSFYQKLESIQYNPAVAITGAVRGHRERSFVKNDVLNTLKADVKFCCFCKDFKTKSPRYLFDTIPKTERTYIPRNDDKSKKKNTLVSGNAGEEKNLHLGGLQCLHHFLI